MSEGTRRWRLDIAYDGADFSGWAAQPDRRTVQGELERWIPRVLRLDPPVPLTVAGRTDAGVHARGQVAHIDLPAAVDPRPDLARRLRRVLEPDVVVRRVSAVPDAFDARFSALWRRYVYRLWDADSDPDPLDRRHVVQVREHLGVDLLNAAGASLLGLRDFAPFCKRREGATTIRTLMDCRAVRLDDPAGTIELTVRADAFCHSMVRSLVGALAAVGASRRRQQWLDEVAASPTRASSVVVMPAAGLTLEEVGYPDEDGLAARAAQSRAVRSADEVADCGCDGPDLPTTPTTHAAR
ncbi:tRNA pseudouridine synthase A [Acidipropionibacterium acidipropionici ATCC 4875]|uniref:tRNA pseudouridine synthase A n=1 Tax=Acidipropionibacterium acidipropionici (strain ATCC 4875 / DSM 20272 / JCM 6432 / NBRC 12425 / NCIMB 8070 / 4) TaxID=1171373 RepID=K7RZ54_ACIA4|nr:tRNA pseudouridine(38-40) synthase TruA [Acidipropionibacterium acidipropionici]AFV90298.1 tRNA pseudouridine synthase A [Acidipropionibacterium acidipropionici ATCC 4875]